LYAGADDRERAGERRWASRSDAYEGEATRARAADVEQRVDAERARNGGSENRDAPVPRLPRPATALLLQEERRYDGVLRATHVCACFHGRPRFSVLPGQCIRNAEQAAVEGGSRLRRLSRLDQFEQGRYVALSVEDHSAADGQGDAGHRYDLRPTRPR